MRVCMCVCYTKWLTAIVSILQLATLGWFTAGVVTLDQTSTLTLTFLFTVLQVPVVTHLKTHTHIYINK